MIEQDNTNIEEREILRCGWCGEIDNKKKVFSSPGDDIENPLAFHENCFKALQAYTILVWSFPEKTSNELIKMANSVAGIPNNKKKRTK